MSLNREARWPAQLARVDPAVLSRLLYRGVFLNTLLKVYPAQPLFASSSANRYNRKGNRVLYFGEDVLTAFAETVQESAGLLLDAPTREEPDGALATHEPVVLFTAEAHLKRVLDLTDDGVLAGLGLTAAELFNPWRWQSSQGLPVVTQQIGEAAFESGCFEAIRYPSDKARDRRVATPAANWAIFVDRLTFPSRLLVVDPSGRLLGQLPPF